MSPAVEPANAPAVGSVAAEKLLNDGEVILLHVKPSGWFVLLISWPVLAVAVIVAVGGCLATRLVSTSLPPRVVLFFCIAVACGRLAIGCLQWMGRTYILTNVRVLNLKGVLRRDVLQCPLKRIKGTTLSATRIERLLGLGNLSFQTGKIESPETAWIDIPRPVEVQHIVDQAINRAK